MDDAGYKGHKCPKCSGAMDLGHLRDRMRGRASRPAEWITGHPETNWTGSLVIRGKVRYIVDSLRCRQCGYVELYANRKLPVSSAFGLPD